MKSSKNYFHVNYDLTQSRLDSCLKICIHTFKNKKCTMYMENEAEDEVDIVW